MDFLVGLGFGFWGGFWRMDFGVDFGVDFGRIFCRIFLASDVVMVVSDFFGVGIFSASIKFAI